MKKVLSLVLMLAMVLSCCASVFAAEPELLMTTAIYGASPKTTIASNDITIMVTNDVHCGNYAKYAKVATLAKDADILADAGDHIQGGVLGSISKGEYIVKIMNAVGYDIATFGNHEYDYGTDRLAELVKMANYSYVSCNFVNLGTKTSLYDAYKIIEVKGKKIAFVGITTPETFAKSTPTYFQDADGNYIYGFCEGGDGQELYDQVQKTVDAAKAAGADYIVALSHLGIDEESSPWTVDELLANVTGIDVCADAHSHSVYSEVKNGVPTVQTGTQLANVAKIVIAADGTITTENIALDDTIEDDATVKAVIADIDAEYKAEVNKVVAKTEVKLTTKNEDGTRAVRSKETNLGDLCADAYRELLGADIAFVNGGGIRADLEIGDLTKADIITVHPFGNMACLVEVTGQQILDALELGASKCPNELGGFLQVSGITYSIDTSIPSSVVLNDKSEFVEVAGARRVFDVKVGGVDIDPEKKYTLASHNYMLKSAGDGYAMFGKNNVTILKDEVMVDNEVLINYIVDKLGGVVGEEYAEPQGRINIVASPVFTDVAASYWGYRAVSYAVTNGYFKGVGNDEFAPNDIISMSEAVVVLYKVAGQTAESTSDVWYARQLAWAENLGVIADEDFVAAKGLSREMFIGMLYKTLATTSGNDMTVTEEMKAALAKATDYADIEAEYVDAMAWAVNVGLIAGTEEDVLTVAADAEISRAETATIIQAYFTKVAK